MVTIQKISGTYNTGILELVGKSSDTKPTVKIENVPIINGSTYFEIDTKKAFIYDQDTNTWIEL